MSRGEAMADHRCGHAHRDRAHRARCAAGEISSRELLELLPCADRQAQPGDQRRRDAGTTAPSRPPPPRTTRPRPRREVGTAARAADHHQGLAGNRRAADHRRRPRVGAPRAEPGRRRRGPTALGRGDRLRQDQPAGLRGGLADLQPAFSAPRAIRGTSSGRSAGPPAVPPPPWPPD